MYRRSIPPHTADNEWRFQLDKFIKEHEKQLAALNWGLLQEWGSNTTLGIDLSPKPHFVACSQEAIDQLNQQVDNLLQEIVGVVDGYNPEKEVVMLGIGNSQIKLINFQPDPSPPVCFEEIEEDLDTLIQILEERLCSQME